MQQNGKLDVFLAVGHGVEPNGVFDPGAIGTDGRQEHAEAFQVCTYALAAMRRSGLTVVSETAQGASHDPDFHGSAKRANQLQPRVAIEVHFDSSHGRGRILRPVLLGRRPGSGRAHRRRVQGPGPAPGRRRAPPRALVPEQHAHAGAHPGDPPGARLAGRPEPGAGRGAWPKAPARSSATRSSPRIRERHRAPGHFLPGPGCPGPGQRGAARSPAGVSAGVPHAPNR